MCMFWGFWLSQRIADDSVLLGCDSVSGKWLPSYVSPRVEQCKSFFVLGPWETLQDKDTTVFSTSGSTHPTSHLGVQFVPVPAFYCDSQPELLSSALEAVC
jgi:hypothetical protein